MVAREVPLHVGVEVRLGLFEDEDGEAAEVSQDEDKRSELADERGGERHGEAPFNRWRGGNNIR